MIFSFSKKNKLLNEGLDKALELELITKREYLELKYNRAKNDLEKHTLIKIKVKNKK